MTVHSNTNINIDIDPADYKILIVDDVISNVLLLKTLLKKEEYQIITANNGTEALQMTEQEMPDLILLDVMMPDISGFEVSQRLKSSEDYKDIPIIFLTALNRPEDIVKGFQLGANDFITKPFNKDELKIRISHQIALISAKRIILKQTAELQNTIIGRDKLYSVIAHDLRGPMGSIKMVLNLLASNIQASTIGESEYELLNTANQTTEDVFALLDNLLKWTKSQIGRLNVVYQNKSITDTLKDSIDICSLTANLKNITIKLTADKDINVYADIDMIKTIMRNLMSNAIKFSHQNGTIEVSLLEDNDFAIVSVKDNGCGIKAEDKTRLLNVDTHFSTFGTNNEEGSGLGLLLCKDFAIKNGGNLWFDSVENEGSTFSFSVPKTKID